METEIKNKIEIKPSSIKEAISFAYIKAKSKTIKNYMEKKIVSKDIFKMNY